MTRISKADLELVTWAVGHVAGDSDRKGAKLLGVVAVTLKRWRNAFDQGREADLPELKEDTREKLLSKRLRGGAVSGYRPSGDSDLTRQIDDILHSKSDELTKTARMIDLWGIYRQKAIADVTELLKGEQAILAMRTESLRNLTRIQDRETEEAATRRKEHQEAERREREKKDAAVKKFRGLAEGGAEDRDQNQK